MVGIKVAASCATHSQRQVQMRLLKGPRLPVTNNCLLGTCSLSLAVLRGIDEDCISESSQEVCSRSGKRPNGRRDKGRTGLGLRKQPRRYCLQRRSGTWCVARTEVARWPRHPYSHTESELQERQGSWRFGMPQSEVIGEKNAKGGHVAGQVRRGHWRFREVCSVESCIQGGQAGRCLVSAP